MPSEPVQRRRYGVIHVEFRNEDDANVFGFENE
jgi:hypothetical protein